MSNTTCKRVPVSFLSGPNRLYGVIHYPETIDNNKLPLIMLSAGLKNKTGYARLFVKMADHMAANGHITMRFDYFGCGDSDGMLNPTNAYEELHADINEQLSMGVHAEDTIAAIAKLKEETGVDKVILCGLCSGANASVYVGARSDDTKAMILMNMPVLVDSVKNRKLKEGKMNLFQEQVMYESYLRKIFSPKAWWRILTFQSEFKSIVYLFKKNLFGNKKQATPVVDKAAEEEQGMVFNSEMLGKMEEYFKSNRRLYFYLSENDPIRVNFEEYFENRHGVELLKKYPDLHDRYLFKDANHAFINDEWKKELYERVLQCLRKEAEL